MTEAEKLLFGYDAPVFLRDFLLVVVGKELTFWPLSDTYFSVAFKDKKLNSKINLHIYCTHMKITCYF